MTLTTYDDEKFFCNIKLPAFKKSWLVEDCLDLKLLQCAQCTKIFWRKIGCNIVEPRTKAFVPHGLHWRTNVINTLVSTRKFVQIYFLHAYHRLTSSSRNGMKKFPNGWCTEVKYVDNRIILKLNLRYLYHWLHCW